MSFGRYETNPNTCSHKSSIGCCLATTRECCACTDPRPFAPAYPIYIDGEGIKYQGTRWERYCWKCKDYWNASYSTGPYQIPTLAEVVPTEHQRTTSPPSLSAIYPRMTSLPLTSSFDNNPGENQSQSPSYPADGSNERIARLRSELQGVRTGIQRIVSGLQDLNDTTHQQELAAQASLHSFTMSTRAEERSPPRGSRSIFQGNLEASAWSNIPNPPHLHNPATIRTPPHLNAARARPSGQDPPLRVRQRAYLESDQQRQATVANDTSITTAPQSTHRRPTRENPFQALGTREEVERPEYQSPLANLYGNAWGDYRNAEAARQGQNPGASNGVSTAGIPQPMMPNPLVNPPAMQQYPPAYFANPTVSGPQPYLNPIGLQGITTPDLTPPVRYNTRDTSGGNPARWSFHHLAPPASNRRLQNLSAPDRANGNSDSAFSLYRAADAHRRAAHRPGSESGSIPRSMELSSGDMVAARTGFPYALPGGLTRNHYHGGYHSRDSGSDSESEPSLTFDSQDRPPPMDPESMMLDMACSICKEHLVDTVVLPCGHAVMCNWCADIHVPTRKQDKSTPKDRSAKCPMCRSRIKQKFKIFHS